VLLRHTSDSVLTEPSGSGLQQRYPDNTNSLAGEGAGGELIHTTEEKAWYSEPQTDENYTEKSAKLVIDHVANKSVHYVSVGTFF
jgi:hypothetical protein